MANDPERRKKKSNGLFKQFRAAFTTTAERAGASEGERRKVRRKRKKGSPRFLKGG